MSKRQWVAPKKVQILGKTWQVRVAPAADDDKPEDEPTYGQTVTSDGIITLFTEPHLSHTFKGPMASTLFHECCHAALETSGVTSLLTDAQEECIIRALEEGIWPLIERGVFNGSRKS